MSLKKQKNRYDRIIDDALRRKAVSYLTALKSIEKLKSIWKLHGRTLFILERWWEW